MAFYANSINEEEHIMKLRLIENFFNAFSKTLKSAINELKKAELRYQTLFKAARDAILIIDEKSTKILDVNKQAEKLFEMERKDLIGLNALNFSPKELSQNFFEQIRTQVDLDDAPHIELEITNSIGKTVPVEISINQINLEGQNLIQCILRDITERKKAEQELVLSEKRYRNAYEDINFYKDLFAHDIKNILNNIQSSLQLFSIFQHKPIKLKEINDIIKGEVLRGVKLISDIKRTSQFDESEKPLKPIDIYSFLKGSISFLRKTFQDKDLFISVKAPLENYTVYANELIIDVFENILLNAVKYNDNLRVEIVIHISRVKEENENYIKFEFLDNGVGLNALQKKEIFQKSGKKENYIRGTGFGLLFVNKIIKNYNGKIWVEDRIKGEPKKGSNFVILIPEVI
jgi:PAS domain S-box-containing protein